MILSFKKQFVQPIIDGKKIHTIREDIHDRWQDGMSIQFWKGNPRNIEQKPYEFFPHLSPMRHVNWKGTLPPTCVSTQKIQIKHSGEAKTIVYIDGDQIEDHLVTILAGADGFLSRQHFSDWFFPLMEKTGEFNGKIIHWTTWRYRP